MHKCTECNHFVSLGRIKGKEAYYCNCSSKDDYIYFICYGHPHKPIIPLSPQWCPMKKGKVN